MRHFGTDAERMLWARLRGRRLDGFKFRRQVWIGPFIVDFLCVEARLVVEADGGQHGEALVYDQKRDEMLAHGGYRVLRFWNNDIADNLDGVLSAIRSTLLACVPFPSRPFGSGPSLSHGEGGL